MIFEKVLEAVTAVISMVLGLFPSWSDPTWADPLGDILWDIGSTFRRLDAWVNVPVLLTVMGLLFGALVAVFLAKTGVWLYRLLPLT